MTNKPITMLTVLCDARTLQHISITCRCTRKWVEMIPLELHNSSMIMQLECPSCGQIYHLYHKHLHRFTGGTHDRSEQAAFGIANADATKREYDA